MGDRASLVAVRGSALLRGELREEVEQPVGADDQTVDAEQIGLLPGDPQGGHNDVNAPGDLGDESEIRDLADGPLVDEAPQDRMDRRRRGSATYRLRDDHSRRRPHRRGLRDHHGRRHRSHRSPRRGYPVNGTTQSSAGGRPLTGAELDALPVGSLVIAEGRT